MKPSTSMRGPPLGQRLSRAHATDGLLEVREESGGGRCSREAQAARDAEESALADRRPVSQHLMQLRCAPREVADVRTHGPTRRHWPRRQCGNRSGLLLGAPPPRAPKAINPRDRALCPCHGLCDVRARARGRRDTHHHVGSAGRIRCCTNHRARSRPAGRRHGTRHNACPSASRAPAGRASRSAGLKHTPAMEQPRRAAHIRPEAEEHCQYLFARRIRVALR
jgi:hypothetical protein